MRKTIIMIAIVLLMVLAGYMLINGIKIGNVEICGISNLSEKNKKLDDDIAELSSTTLYDSAKDAVQKSSENLISKKEEYQSLLTVNSSTGTVVSQMQKYELEYLWTKIGNYATEEGVELQMNISVNADTQNTYNLNFSVVGEYINITEFLYDINNDSSLQFKIENFSLTSKNENQLVATFVCKDININITNSNVASEKSTNAKEELEDNSNKEETEDTKNDNNNTKKEE